MNSIAVIVVLALVGCASAGILSPYVGYNGYYSAPVVSRAVVAPRVAYATTSYVSSPYVSSYASPVVRRYAVAAPYAAPVYSSAYVSPYATYPYLLKK